MKPTADFLAQCAQRILAVHRTPRRAFDSLAAECGILIGELCETTEAAEKLTDALVAHPLPRWDFANFRQRAAAFANSTRTQAERDEGDAEWYSRRAVAQAAFNKLPPHKQQSLALAWRRKIDSLIEANPEADFIPPWRYAGGACMRLRTLVNLPDYSHQLDQMAVSDIMEEQYQRTIRGTQKLRPKSPTS
jgi:hypothetical protein